MSILGETVGAVILAFIIFKEAITFKQGIGIIFIIFGLVIFLWGKSKVKEF